MPRLGLLPKDSVTQLREKLDYAEIGPDGQKQRRYTNLNDELRVFVRRFKTRNGTPAAKLVDWRDDAHQAGLDELTTSFLDEHGFGDMYWPENPEAENYNRLTYKRHRAFIWDHVKQVFWRMNSLADRNQKHKNKKNLADAATRSTVSTGTRSPSEPQQSATASTFGPSPFESRQPQPQPPSHVEDSLLSRPASSTAPDPQPTSSAIPETAPKPTQTEPRAQAKDDKPSAEAKRLKRIRDKGSDGRNRGGKRAKTKAPIPGERASPRHKKKTRRDGYVDWKGVSLDFDNSQPTDGTTTAGMAPNGSESHKDPNDYYNCIEISDDENDGDYTPSIPSSIPVDPKLAAYFRPATEDQTPAPVPPSPSTTGSNPWLSKLNTTNVPPSESQIGTPVAPIADMQEMRPPSRSATLSQAESRMPPASDAPRDPPTEPPVNPPAKAPIARATPQPNPQPTTHPATYPTTDPAASPGAEPFRPPMEPSSRPKTPPDELPKHSEPAPPAQPPKPEVGVEVTDTKPRAKPSVAFGYRVVFSRTPNLVSTNWNPQGRFQDKSLAELIAELPFGPQVEGLVFTISGPGMKTIERLQRDNEAGLAMMKRFINEYVREWLKLQRQRQLAGDNGAAAPHLAVDISIELMTDENRHSLDDQLLKTEEEEDLDLDW